MHLCFGSLSLIIQHPRIMSNKSSEFLNKFDNQNKNIGRIKTENIQIENSTKNEKAM